MAQTAAATIRSVPWRVQDAFAVFLLPWVLLPVAVIFGAEALKSYVPFLATFYSQIESGDPHGAFILELVDAVGSFVLIGYFLRRNKIGITSLGWRKFPVLKVVGYAVLILLGFTVLVAAADAIVQTLYPSYNVDQPQTNEFTTHASTLSLWALVILPPIVEETVYRGFIFPAFAKRYGIFGGAVCASILFGFAHLQLNVSIYTFVLGLLLCLLYSRVGSIIPGIAIHMLNNYVAYMAMHQK